MRLIDADELKKVFHAEWDGVLVWDESGETTADEFCNLVDAAPTIEAEPVVHCIDCITDEIAQKIIEEANKACTNCQEWVCDECEYRHWRNKG